MGRERLRKQNLFKNIPIVLATIAAFPQIYQKILQIVRSHVFFEIRFCNNFDYPLVRFSHCSTFADEQTL